MSGSVGANPPDPPGSVFPVLPGPVDAVVGPVGRAGVYYAKAWRNYLRRGWQRSREVKSGELPIVRPTAALAAHALRDEIVLLGMRLRRRLNDVAAFARIADEVKAAVAFYDRKGWLDNPEEFFTAPPDRVVVTVNDVKSRRHSHRRLTFRSDYKPHRGEPGRDRWLGYDAGERGYALMLRHRGPASWLVCIHGAEMGRAGMDLTVFHARHLHEDLGLNVILPVLPMHGPRGRRLPRGAAFPGEDVLDNVHATAQAVWDIRALIGWIRRQEPDSPIGLNAISLGGYVASLVASVEDGLACAILGVPVANLVELLIQHSRVLGDDARRDVYSAALPIGTMTSALSMTPKVPLSGRFIYAGIADRMVHPRKQVARLWEHWGRPEIVWYRGGHTGFWRSRRVDEFIDDALRQSGMIS